MIRRTNVMYIDLTPEELAFEFANMTDNEQAVFFNELAVLTETWGQSFDFQLQRIFEHPDITVKGRLIMKKIGQSFYWEEVKNEEKNI